MPFTVIWTPDAEVGLAQLYNNAPRALRGGIARASDRIEKQLKHSGNQLGAPLPNTAGDWFMPNRSVPIGSWRRSLILFPTTCWSQFTCRF